MLNSIQIYPSRCHSSIFSPPLICASIVLVSEDNVDVIVADGAVEALVPHLSAPEVAEGEEPVACEHEVEKDAALAIGLLAVKVQPRNPQILILGGVGVVEE